MDNPPLRKTQSDIRFERFVAAIQEFDCDAEGVVFEQAFVHLVPPKQTSLVPGQDGLEEIRSPGLADGFRNNLPSTR